MNKNIITISIIAFIAFSGGFLAATAINYSKEPGSDFDQIKLLECRVVPQAF